MRDTVAMSVKKETEVNLYAVRIQNGQRGITVLLESEESPDMLALYRTFCSSTEATNSERLHIEFASWLEDLGWEKCQAKIFNVYNPELVRSQS